LCSYKIVLIKNKCSKILIKVLTYFVNTFVSLYCISVLALIQIFVNYFYEMAVNALYIALFLAGIVYPSAGQSPITTPTCPSNKIGNRVSSYF